MVAFQEPGSPFTVIDSLSKPSRTDGSRAPTIQVDVLLSKMIEYGAIDAMSSVVSSLFRGQLVFPLDDVPDLVVECGASPAIGLKLLKALRVCVLLGV